MKKLMRFSLGYVRQTKKMLDRSLPPAPLDYLPNDIIINRNWKELGWAKKKMRAYQVYSFPAWMIQEAKSSKKELLKN